ncbi:MarR family transcriptional regulator [Salinibacterium sp. NSLL150]|uniref:MarR family winged helix-turn-helix transcriptional regulator n=1 Tax=unclassified Salinibacterium TaxID=2632331 RepID=UPI0018CC9CB4|nr:MULTISPECIES: MarR family transcriptional regulator [unclassified Salinibacterium]MBH0099798.1 MarR family transcriptional regulator [Salinibacterium sp. NSLL35]MBH0102552.1 MarR family transcriptional regulator [Salinibacterium sp. NSLL150]MBH0105312.1 MarR family transcriptional regulator [Salinibacterium sp. NSLL16]MBH0108072.1 MarR family transcriptional regulator [Salinibacterium sp. NSLL17]MBH0110843.1 MarR family transcriptional regulator [Salinibacterium sp. NG22]
MDDEQNETESASSALDTMLCFGLYAAARATNRRYTALLAPWGLTYPQYLVLILLWERRSSTVSGLAESLMLDLGTTSPLIRRLEDRGFVTRERSESDERRVIVSLTAAGRALREELAHIPGCIAEATGITLPEFTSTLSTLHQVTTNLSTAPAAGAHVIERQN